MNPNQYTIKGQEAIAAAQQLAFNASNTQIETGHLLQALLNDDDASTEMLLKKCDANINFINQKLADNNKKYASTTNNIAQMISKEMNAVMLKAQNYLKEFGDEFISADHLLLALINANDATSNILKDGGVVEKDLKQAIKSL
jgi:ATP-dependent Clp protease ATP-binding subunit ClpB